MPVRTREDLEGLRMLQVLAKCCTLGSILRTIDAVLLLLVLVFQGSSINFHLIKHNEGSVAWYFWFLADFLVLITMMSAVFLAQRHHRQMAQNPEGTEPSPSHVILGRFPLCYISWLMYALLLVAKITIMFRMDIGQVLDSENLRYGAQFVLAASSIVFLLLVDSHHRAASDSAQKSYLSSLCTGTTLEIFDSVTFLGLLYPNETRLILTYPLENAVLALTCANFVLPGLALFKLSQCEFGQKPRPLGLKLLYRFLHLGLINIPYLAIRSYLWQFYSRDIALFLIKNILAIFVHTRAMIPEVHTWWQLMKEERGKTRESGALELKVIYNQEEEDDDKPLEKDV